MKPGTSYVSVTDQFCGAGGSSLGASKAGAVVKLAMNHWKLAVETHNSNFPNAAHDCTDISACDPRRYPTTDILITSPECTNHSLAKGKKRKNLAQMSMFDGNPLDPAEERSRATMWDVPRFAEYHSYNLIIVENVVDARNWVMWEAWLLAMQLLGYQHECVYFNSQFAHPTPQSRDRMYVVFWKSGNKKPDLAFRPKAYCVKCAKDVQAIQSWKNPNKRFGKYGKYGQYIYACPGCAQVVQPYYYAAANAIDWSIKAERIGDRKKPLKDKTLRRINAGLEKYGGLPPTPQPGFILEHLHEYRTRGLDEALTTMVAGGNHHSLITTGQPQPFLLGLGGASWQRENHVQVYRDAYPTQTATPTFGLVTPPYIVDLGHSHSSDPGHCKSVFETGCTQTTRQTLGVCIPPQAAILEYKRGCNLRSTDEALSTMLTSGAHHYLVSYYGNGDGVSEITEPAGTTTTRDRHALLSAGSAAVSVDDCGFRMLQPHEVGAAMAFPADYKVLGTNREKVRQYGNAVTPPVMQMILERCIATLAG